MPSPSCIPKSLHKPKPQLFGFFFFFFFLFSVKNVALRRPIVLTSFCDKSTPNHSVRVLLYVWKRLLKYRARTKFDRRVPYFSTIRHFKHGWLEWTYANVLYSRIDWKEYDRRKYLYEGCLVLEDIKMLGTRLFKKPLKWQKDVGLTVCCVPKRLSQKEYKQDWAWLGTKLDWYKAWMGTRLDR